MPGEEGCTDGIHHYALKRQGGADRRLIVTFATHNTGARFASIAAIERGMAMDVLGFRDPSNGYYCYDDGGARFGALLRQMTAGYDPASILFFGSSMAGYAALRWAIELNACCVVSNPQVNLDASATLAWETLRRNILRIPQRVNIDELPPGPRRAVLTVLHSRHRMDQENMRRLFAFWLTAPGMVLNLHQVDEALHSYLIRDFQHFRKLVELTYAERARLERAAVTPPAAPAGTGSAPAAPPASC